MDGNYSNFLAAALEQRQATAAAAASSSNHSIGPARTFGSGSLVVRASLVEPPSLSIFETHSDTLVHQYWVPRVYLSERASDTHSRHTRDTVASVLRTGTYLLLSFRA